MIIAFQHNFENKSSCLEAQHSACLHRSVDTQHTKSLQDTDIILAEAAKAWKHAAIIDQRELGNANNKMKGIWYMERNQSYTVHIDCIYIYILFYSSVRQILELGRAKHVLTICFSNMWHQPVTQLLPPWPNLIFNFLQSKGRGLGKDLHIITVLVNRFFKNMPTCELIYLTLVQPG